MVIGELGAPPGPPLEGSEPPRPPLEEPEPPLKPPDYHVSSKPKKQTMSTDHDNYLLVEMVWIVDLSFCRSLRVRDLYPPFWSKCMKWWSEMK